MSDKLYETRVISAGVLSNNGHLLTFEASGKAEAGQTVGITTDTSIPPRYYSLISPKFTETHEILYTLVPDGVLTPKLTALKEGDTIYATEPGGSFLDSGVPTVWICNGTGVAPFVSMVRSGKVKDKILLQGAKGPDSLWFHDLFRNHLDHYIPCLSQESHNNAFHGRLTVYLREHFTRDYPNWKNYRYMLCGSTGMVVEVRKILLNAGVLFTSISSEVYF